MLNIHLNEESVEGEELFLVALCDVAKAYGMSEVLEKTKLGRESLHKALSVNGNPKLKTLRNLLKVMCLKIKVEVSKKRAS